MSTPYCEKVDVFLPGKGDSLLAAPDYHWERAEGMVGMFFFSTRDPNTILISPANSTREQKRRLAQARIIVDHTNQQFHDLDGFGVHIPGLLVTAHGTAIAVCQRRHDSTSDGRTAKDILLSRSEDGGRTWSRQEVLCADPASHCCPSALVEDRSTGTLFLAFWKVPAQIVDILDYFRSSGERCAEFWLLKSTDEGRTWSAPAHVRPAPNAAGWVGWSNNGVHGIQLTKGAHAGRLVIPAFLYKEGEPGQVPGIRGGLLYSDDHGESWCTGAVLPDGSDEASLVETITGDIYVSYRKNTRRTGYRHYARSTDGGESVAELGQHEDLPGPGVDAGLVRYTSPTDGQPPTLLYSHPPSRPPVTDTPAPRMGGSDLTVYLSRDEGRTWPVSRLVEPGPARYSDLAVTDDGTILCLYSNGERRDLEKISVVRFNLAWLLDGQPEPVNAAAEGC